MNRVDGATVLTDLPPALLPALLQAVRSAADRLGRSRLPAAIRPYAGFTPQALGDGRARRAVIDALARDARLREAVGRALGEPVWHHAEEAPAAQLVDRYGPAVAVAALVTHARWSDVAEVAADHATHDPERTSVPPASAPDGDHRAEVITARQERAAADRRATAAERRVQRLEADLARLRRRVEELERERDAAAQEADDERSRGRDRLARLRRRAAQAESRARVDVGRLAGIAAQLEGLATQVRAAVDHDAGADAAEESSAEADADEPRSGPRLPDAPTATAGRPAVLPKGLTPDRAEAIRSLLDLPGITVIVDGYNVSKDLRGVPGAPLPEQRAWLERLLAGVAAGRDLTVSVVFDGAEGRASAERASRVVRTVYTAADETADDHIIGMVEALPTDAPAVVVTSDRALAEAVAERSVNVVSSGDFLRAVT